MSSNAAITTSAHPVASDSIEFSSALEAARVVCATPCILTRLLVQIDFTAPAGVYFVQLIAPTGAGAVPADGAVSLLQVPIARSIPVGGAYDLLQLDFGHGLPCLAGACVVLSTTRFTKTAAGAYMSIGAQFRK